MHSDVLIVGAGSAGSVLAERLSRDSQRRVTVLETGPDTGDATIAGLIGDGLRLPLGPDSPVVTRYPTLLTDEPERRADLVRGAVTGGSGAVNGGYFCRPPAGDFTDWALPGWTWPEVLPHFRAIETDLDFTGPLHGDDGPIRVRRAADPGGISARFAEAATRAGISWLDDLNGDHPRLPDGIGAVPSNTIDGHRLGPGNAFLARAVGRPNLLVYNRIQVTGIEFTGSRATGVVGRGPDGPVRFGADAVVLCAGAIGTAKLLMLSGIGDPAQLAALGVETRVAAPVGSACSDHPEWVLPTDWAPATRRPVLEVVLSLADGLEIRPYTKGFGAMTGTPGSDDPVCIAVALMTPAARGTVRLRSADPAAAPDIRQHYDTRPGDTRKLSHGVAAVREILSGTVTIGDPSWSTSQHLCGTAPMGVEGDARAVLDPQCRVRGIDGLWVIDGSALPAAPGRGPHAVTVMLAHRAAEFVR
ncbi:MAG: mycofactocin system GMC family oxidoreductase MftG [Mycobacterium sp.]|nr:mycofactocin system GMC family oxidoreductase MftG [Mycobacterium sp.]